jgi:Rrf2 family protein
MKLINRDTDYAVKALLYIARKSERVTISELVEELGMPRPFLRKIFQILNKEGVLNSYKGKGGGFLMAIPPEHISLTDLIRIFQGQLKLKECIINNMICPDVKTCPLRNRIHKIEKHIISEFNSITLASLFREDSRQWQKK